MKTFKKQIDTVLISLVVLLSLNLYAQKSSNTKKAFLRVYDLEGRKIGKGNIVFVNDSLLGLNKNGKQEKISFSDMGSIKTKRSGGHNLIMGASSGILFGAILGSTNPPTESTGGTFTWAGGSSAEEFTAGLAVGAISGTIIGGISCAFKNSETYIINGEANKWLVFKETFESIKFK